MTRSKITTPQLAKLHCMLSQLALMDSKKELIRQFTDGRTESSKELSFEEARDLISSLSRNDPRERHIKAIWHLARTCGLIYGNGFDDNKMNAAKLDRFLRERGAVKKNLTSLNLQELKKVHRQFEAMSVNIRKGADNNLAKWATAQLLKELNIKTQ